MSYEMPTILYVGCPAAAEHLRTAIAPIGGYVYTAATLFDALAIVVNFWPDRVLLDASAVPDLVDPISEQLADIDVQPMIVHSSADLMAAVADLLPALEWADQNLTP